MELGDRRIQREKAKTMRSTAPCRRRSVEGPIIVGAGPSGLATAVCLSQRGPNTIPSLILEKESCIASMWRLRTYDRLRLHLPKHFCELPFSPFPKNFPTYPTRDQFVDYLESYAARFNTRVAFNRTVTNAEFDPDRRIWVVRAEGVGAGDRAAVAEEEEYESRWLVVATGENGEAAVPEIEGMGVFGGAVIHTSEYRNGERFRGKKVMVVGCGNSGMEVSLDLCNCNASTFLVVRDSVHILPQEMLGRSTFGVAMWLLRWLPPWAVDWLLVWTARLMLGDTARLGIRRPKVGPLQLKHAAGKTPVLDVGTLAHIKRGHIQVRPGIKRVMNGRAEFVDGRVEEFDAIILATGYKSSVPSWLKENGMFSEENGPPIGWKGKHGLYAVGFTNQGLMGTSTDARRIAEDIGRWWEKMHSPIPPP